MLRPVRSIATCTTVPPTKLAACAGLVPWRDEQARYPALGEKKKKRGLLELAQDRVVKDVWFVLSGRVRGWPAGRDREASSGLLQDCPKAQWQLSLTPVPLVLDLLHPAGGVASNPVDGRL